MIAGVETGPFRVASRGEDKQWVGFRLGRGSVYIAARNLPGYQLEQGSRGVDHLTILRWCMLISAHQLH